MDAVLSPYVIVNLDRPRRLKYDMNAMAEAETVLDMPVISDSAGESVFRRLAEKRGNVRFLRGLLWAGLLYHEPKITLAEVGNLITLNNMPEVVDGINKALTLFFRAQGVEVTAEEAAPAASLQ